MSTETVKRCDVTGKIRDDVRTIRLLVEKVTLDETETVIASTPVQKITCDLCDEALTRLLKFVDKGTTPPGGKGKG